MIRPMELSRNSRNVPTYRHTWFFINKTLLFNGKITGYSINGAGVNEKSGKN